MSAPTSRSSALQMPVQNPPLAAGAPRVAAYANGGASFLPTPIPPAAMVNLALGGYGAANPQLAMPPPTMPPVLPTPTQIITNVGGVHFYGAPLPNVGLAQPFLAQQFAMPLATPHLLPLQAPVLGLPQLPQYTVPPPQQQAMPTPATASVSLAAPVAAPAAAPVATLAPAMNPRANSFKPRSRSPAMSKPRSPSPPMQVIAEGEEEEEMEPEPKPEPKPKRKPIKDMAKLIQRGLAAANAKQDLDGRFGFFDEEGTFSSGSFFSSQESLGDQASTPRHTSAAPPPAIVPPRVGVPTLVPYVTTADAASSAPVKKVSPLSRLLAMTSLRSRVFRAGNWCELAFDVGLRRAGKKGGVLQRTDLGEQVMEDSMLVDDLEQVAADVLQDANFCTRDGHPLVHLSCHTGNGLQALRYLVAVAKGACKIAYAGQVTSHTDELVAIARDLGRAPRGRHGRTPARARLVVRFCLLPRECEAVREDPLVAGGELHGAVMTVLFQCGEVERALEQVPCVFVRAKAMFGHLPPSLGQRARPSSRLRVVMKGVATDYRMGRKLQDLGIDAAVRPKILRGRGQKRGAQFADLQHRAQVEYLVSDLRHLFVERIQSTKQPRFVMFERFAANNNRRAVRA